MVVSAKYQKQNSQDTCQIFSDYLPIYITLEDEIVARVVIAKEDPALLNDIRFTQNALSSNALHVTSGKKNPRHKEIIAAFNRGLAEIKANGVYAKIMESYGIK